MRANAQKKTSTAAAPMKNGHVGGPSDSEPSSRPKPASSAAKTTPPSANAGAAQPPTLRPIRPRRDCGPGSRPGGRWGWSSRAAAIERG